MLMSLAASFRAKRPSAPGTFGSVTYSTTSSVQESPSLFNTFLALFALSTTSCMGPFSPAALALKPRIFTFTLPRAVPMRASVPGRFSQTIVSCLTLGIGRTPHDRKFSRCYQSRVPTATQPGRLGCSSSTQERQKSKKQTGPTEKVMVAGVPEYPASPIRATVGATRAARADAHGVDVGVQRQTA